MYWSTLNRQKISGVFEIRIYPADCSIRNIVAACRVTDPNVKVPGLDLDKLRLILNDIDYKEIRKRRAIYCRLYQEASISHEPGLGISFTNMLLLLAHHKLIVDAEALVSVLLFSSLKCYLMIFC
jgi:hypothetical protein